LFDGLVVGTFALTGTIRFLPMLFASTLAGLEDCFLRSLTEVGFAFGFISCNGFFLGATDLSLIVFG
tara:strand:- start:62 stop:262 length:201 start_codon:yes stop_codon:yes gene_type:complete